MTPAVSRAGGREGIRPAKDETAAGVASGAAACEPESTPPNIVAVPATTTAASRRRSLLPKRRPLLFELAVPGNPFPYGARFRWIRSRPSDGVARNGKLSGG